jgi:hypothetical protein
MPPILAMLLRAPFETRHPSGVNGSVPGTALYRWPRPAKATAHVRAPSDPCGPALARPSRSPPTSSAPTPSSSSDDLQGWVVPGIFSADLGREARCLSLSKPKEPELLLLPDRRTGPTTPL